MGVILPTNTDVQVATDEAFTNILINDSGVYCTSKTFVKDILPYGTDLYARSRHHHPDTGISNWSNVTKFGLAVPASIIGICLDNSGTKGVFYWIDALGNQVNTFDYQLHSIYAGITQTSVDLRAPVSMTKIPLFYVKTAASGPAGTFAAGRKCWWIANYAADGFHPAACFKRTTQKDSNGKYIISPCCYIGTYLGHTETVGNDTVVGSRSGADVSTGETKASYRTLISNRNNAAAGISGFRMFDIWDMGALRLLALVAKANANLQTAFGDNAAGYVYPKTGSTAARLVFKGDLATPQVTVEDLWRCYWYFVDLISVNNGSVSLTSPMDLTSVLSFGTAAATKYKQTTASGWLKDVLDCPFVIGDDTHDLLELFLPKTTNSSEKRGTFCDYHDASTTSSTSDVMVGGYATSTRGIPVSGSGLFCTQFFSTLASNMALEGVRICKN